MLFESFLIYILRLMSLETSTIDKDVVLINKISPEARKRSNTLTNVSTL